MATLGDKGCTGLGGLHLANLITLDIFQLMSFFIVLIDSFLPVSVTVLVIFYFSVTVIVTVNLNNTTVSVHTGAGNTHVC